MDAKDAIIFQQLDVIRSMTENNLRRVGSDFWGTPTPQKETAAPDADKREKASPAAKAPEAPEKPEDTQAPEDIEDLKAELNGYIGLAGIKNEVGDLISLATIYNLRKQHNLPNIDMSMHMVFSGNPGTGKTMIARLMARIYKSLAILSKGQLIEVDRSGLVAGYVGQTAIKTSGVIEKALGGVLFIDEAYALTQNRGENDFGQEAVDTLLKAMEDHREDLVVIVAGYDGLMDEFIHSNPGLESRFNRFLHFDDYSVDEMVEIFKMQLKKGFYTLGEGAEESVRHYIEAQNTNSISFGNARGVRNLFEKVLVNQANRLAAMKEIQKDDLMVISAADVDAAREAGDDKPLSRAEVEFQRLSQEINALQEKQAANTEKGASAQ